MEGLSLSSPLPHPPNGNSVFVQLTVDKACCWRSSWKTSGFSNAPIQAKGRDFSQACCSHTCACISKNLLWIPDFTEWQRGEGTLRQEWWWLDSSTELGGGANSVFHRNADLSFTGPQQEQKHWGILIESCDSPSVVIMRPYTSCKRVSLVGK